MIPAPPACAFWKVWIGPEIEGQSDLGERTLFIRQATPARIEELISIYGPQVKRVWVCKEFTHWDSVRRLRAVFDKVVVEVNRHNVGMLPKEVFEGCQLYYKLPVELKQGDYVCVGQAFSDESFRIGKGDQVDPAMYRQDIPIDE